MRDFVYDLFTTDRLYRLNDGRDNYKHYYVIRGVLNNERFHGIMPRRCWRISSRASTGLEGRADSADLRFTTAAQNLMTFVSLRTAEDFEGCDVV